MHTRQYLGFALLSAALLAAGCDEDDTAATPTGGAGGTGAAAGTGGTGGTGGAGGAGPGDVTVTPTRSDDLLVNPGMGLADFHFGWWCNLPPVTYAPDECATRALGNWPENHPPSGTAYFRWLWRDLEPVRGEIDFDMIDAALQSANAMGETLGLRVMMIDEGGAGVPDWLLQAPYGVPGQWLASGAGTTFWPDYRDSTFQTEHARFIAALGARYDDHPAVDHVDIGSVGCWGEWNTACLDGVSDIIEVFSPQNDTERQAVATAYEQLVDHHLTAFPTTPVVMLGIGSGGGYEVDILVHAAQGGAGWRVDCWGDWGIWGSAWSHQDDLYPAMIANATAAYPGFADLWTQAPIQLEVCATMPDWLDLGWTTAAPDGEVYKTFQWALEQHASVLNAKRTDIPADYVPALEDMLKQNGYRFAIDSFNHASVVAAGAEMLFVSSWTNLGVAPSYLRRTLTYRLRQGTDVALFESPEDIRTWLPSSWQVSDSFTVPAGLASGTYDIEVAILDRAGDSPATLPLPPVQLGIEGRGSDGWYALSQLTVE